MKHYREPEWFRNLKVVIYNIKNEIKDSLNKRTNQIGTIITEQVKRFDDKLDGKPKKKLTCYEQIMYEFIFIKRLLIIILIALIILCIAYFRIIY